MDVGQVTFTIQANNLSTVLQQALQLQTILNNLDGKNFNTLAKGAAKAQATADKHALAVQKQKTEEARTQTQQQKTQTEYARTQTQQEKTRTQYAQTRTQQEKTTTETIKGQAVAIKAAAKVRNDAIKTATDNEVKGIKTTMGVMKDRQKMQQSAEDHALKVARANQKIREGNLRYAKQEAGVINQPLQSMKEYREQWKTNLVETGARMQTLGATVERMTTPFTNVLTGFSRMAGYMLYGKVFQSVQGMFSRYDTMHTYEKILNNIGLDASKKFVVGTGKARTALDNLEKSVLGLPTGLDEIVASMRVYAGITGDVEKATKIAIAANNAFVAGGLDDTRTRMAERQLQNILSNGELTAMQWNSLQKNMPMAFNAVARELGYAQKDAGKLLADLKSSKVSADEFVNAFIKVGTEGSIKNAAQVMKQTWSAVSQNITNALNRMGEGLIKSLDTVYKKVDGRTFLQHILGVDKNGKDVGGGIKHMIDDISESAQKWIKSNPDAILNFFKSLSEIDIKGIASAYADFAGKMLNFYTHMAKLFSGNNGFLLKLVLWANVGAKVIRILGGLTKGLAGPLSGVFAFFGAKGGFGALVGSMAYVGKHSRAIGHVAKHGAAIVGASRTMRSVALTWQGVANKALNIGAIYVVAQAIKVLSQAMKNFDDVEFTPQTVGALGTAVTVTGLLTKFVVGMGNVIGASKTLTIGTAIGTGAFYGISKSLEALGNAVGRMGEGMKAGVGALSEIESMELPSPQKVASVGALVQDLLGAFEISNTSGVTAFGRGINAWSKGLQADNIIKISEAMGSIKKLSKIKISTNALETAKDNFKAIQEFSIDLMGLFNEEEQAQMEKAGGTSRAFKKGSHTLNPTSYAEWKNKIRDFADTISTLATSFSDITLMLDNMKALNKSYGKIGKGDEEKQETFWKNLRERVGTIAEEMYKFAGNDKESPFWKLQQAAAKLKGYDYTIISQALGEIPNMVTAMQEISKLKVDIDETKFEDTMTKVGDFVTQIQKAFAGTNGNLSGGIQGMALDVSALSSAVTGIKQAIKDLNSMPNAKDMSGLVTSIDSAISQLITACARAPELQGYVDQLSATIGSIQELVDSIPTQYKTKTKVKIDGTVDDEVSPKVRKAIRAIRASVNAIPSSITKVVTIRLVGSAVAAGVRGAEAAMAALQNQQHGGRIYRAGGGSLRRGTDTVQAMLTPGEWVMNRHATSMLGDDVLSKLNHLDIRGALNALSLRAGQIQNKTINNNSTKNANVTVNNYHSDGVGYSRAGRFVRAL